MRAAVRNRWLVIALALASGIAFAMSVQGGRWWLIGEAEIGPFGAKRCGGDGCMPAGLNWLGVGDRWMRIGMGTWAAGLISAFTLVVMSARLAVKAIPRLAAKTVLVSITTAAITGVLFAVKFPRGEFPTAELGRGAYLFIAAIALGGAAAVVVLGTKRSA
jgi:hypothetical protein